MSVGAQVSVTIRASGEEAPWGLRSIFEAVFILECYRIADSILKAAVPILQTYVAKRDKVNYVYLHECEGHTHRHSLIAAEARGERERERERERPESSGVGPRGVPAVDEAWLPNPGWAPDCSTTILSRWRARRASQRLARRWWSSTASLTARTPPPPAATLAT